MSEGENIKVIAGLGNPGAKYEDTRHNAGFILVDSLVEGSWEEKKDIAYAKQDDIFFVKPLSYMNLSGQPLRKFLGFYKISPESLLVVHDEIDLKLGELRLKKGGGAAGHNGIKSVAEELGTNDFYRLRLGVGRPKLNEERGFKIDVSDWVLQSFLKEEQNQFNEMLSKAKEMLKIFFDKGLREAQKEFH